jgi:hypothetical protein
MVSIASDYLMQVLTQAGVVKIAGGVLEMTSKPNYSLPGE